MMVGIEYRINPSVSSEALNELFASAWDGHVSKDFVAQLKRSLFFVCAFSGSRLVGFVKVISDAGVHVFLLDTTVHREFQHCGIGRELVTRAIIESRARGWDCSLVGFGSSLTAQPVVAKLGKLGGRSSVG